LRNFYLILILIFLSGITPTHSQNRVIDDLLIKIKMSKNDSNKVNLLNKLSTEYDYLGESGYESSLKFGNQALQLAQKISFARGITEALYNIGNVYADQGNNKEALKNYQQSLKLNEGINNKNGIAICYNLMGVLFLKHGNYNGALENFVAALKINTELNNKKGMVKNLNNIGVINFNQGDYNKAINSNLKSLGIAKEIGDKKEISNAYNNIGSCYYRQGNYSEALNNYLASLRLDEQLGNKNGIADNYVNIGIIEYVQGNYKAALSNYINSLKYNLEIKDSVKIANNYLNIGLINYEQGNHKEALKNQEASLKINRRLQLSNEIAINLTNIGLINLKLRNYSEALENQLTSLNIYTTLGDKEGIANAMINIGSVYTYTRNFQKADEAINNGLSIAIDIHNKNRIKEAYLAMALLDSAQGFWKGAYDHKNMYFIYRDSLINEVNTKKLVQSQMQYEFDKKAQSIKLNQDKKDAISKEELQRQKLIRNSLIFGFIIVIGFTIAINKQRSKVKREKQRSDELLLNILPSEVAEELKETGTAIAKNYEMVTVLFTDFKGFTAISEKLRPDVLVAEINYCFSAFDNIITKHGVEKIKTIGDSYMCAGGLPLANTTNPEDVVRAGLEIRDFMLKYKKEKEATGAFAFEIRIGINTGHVVAGIVGIKKFAYDIWGDTVNLASRMETSGEPGEVNISASTYNFVKEKFNCKYRGKINIKGKGDADMYFVEHLL